MSPPTVHPGDPHPIGVSPEFNNPWTAAKAMLDLGVGASKMWTGRDSTPRRSFRNLADPRR